MYDATGSRVKLSRSNYHRSMERSKSGLSFSDAFTKTIHNNQISPRLQKFINIYLRSCVFEAAARAIEGIELSDDNYSVGAIAGKI